MLYRLAAPALFALDPETAHRLTVAALRWSPSRAPATGGALATEIAGVRFPNPVGLAAGFDKNAEVPDAMLGLGFGFVEMTSPEDGRKAIEALQGSDFNGRSLTINEAKPREPRRGPGDGTSYTRPPTGSYSPERGSRGYSNPRFSE